MYKQRTLLFIFLFCLIGTSRFFSQIVSTADSVSGCAPFAVTYAAPAGTTSHNWDFGNNLSSTSASGSFNYVSAGTYTITYSGLSGSTPVTFTVIAYVIPKPVALFSINQPPNSCAPKIVTFTDQSIGPLINKWIWTYGDGGGNTFTLNGNTTYTYTLPGNYSVTLQVYDKFGCTDQKTIGTVSVFPSPSAVINSVPPTLFSCTAPFSAFFNGTGSAGSNLTYAWNFGNGQTSTATTPGNITYTNTATYGVSLTVTGNGCSSTATTQVVISPTSLTVTVPPVICLNAPFTATVQSNQNYTAWDFGNGAQYFPGTGTMTLPAYTSTGAKTMTITSGPYPCQLSVLRSVQVESVTANFTITPPATSCSSPFQVSFVNLSSANATQFKWIYPTWQAQDTLTTTGPNPVITFTQNSLNPYTIYKPYAPTVTLIAISAAGCKGTVKLKLDSIVRPTAYFVKTVRQGCAPLVVTLIDSSFIYQTNPITSYTWSSGETPPIQATGTGSNIPNITYTYNTAGTYTPFLTIQTANGCLERSFIDTVFAANPPNVSFTIAPTGTICPNQPLQIINTTPAATSVHVTHWHVNGDDGFFSGCISDPNPSWNFSHIGQHTLSLTGYVHECAGTSTLINTIYVNGPIVQGRYTTNCTNRFSVDFNSDVQGAQAASLNFGDGSPVHTIAGSPTGIVADLVTHVYTLTGNYVATLSGTNNGSGCPVSTYTMLVTVRNVSASVVVNPAVICQNVVTTFSANASQDVFISCSRGYVWYADNLPPYETTIPTNTFSFASTGIHHVILRVKDVNSCSDSYTLAVRVSSVTPLFSMTGLSATSPTVCVNGTVQFTNTSISVAGDPITTYLWDFGDGSPASYLTNPSHTYATASVPYSSYPVALTASNVAGCVSTFFKTIEVFKPDNSFSASQSNICLGPTNIVFTANGTYPGYTLSLGSSSISSTSSVMPYTMTTAGTFVFNLAVTDYNGCQNFSGSQVSITAQQTPTANFSFSSPKSTTNGNVICSPATVSFTDTSLPAQTYTYTWNLGSGNPVVSQSVVSYPYTSTTTTVIPISLKVTTSNQCQDTKAENFTVYSPKAKISLSKTLICLGDPVSFTIIDTSGSGIKGWVWDYGDASPSGGTITANSSPPSFTAHPYTSYPASGTASVSLIYYSAGFACFDSATAQVKLIKVDAEIKRNNETPLASIRADSVHCLNIMDNFYNISSGSSQATTWHFGDGSTSTQENPSYTYSLPGVYQVSLSVTEGSMSCMAITAKGMTINPLPRAAIASKDSICQDAPFDLTGTGTSTAGIASYQWMPLNGVSSASLATTIASASVSGNYSLEVTDNNGCVSPPAIKYIYIQQPAPLVNWDTTVIVGQPVPINTRSGSNFTYTWTPANDLSCLNCMNPTSSSTVNIIYSVAVADKLGCFVVTDTYSVYIDPQTSVDVPTAFTPNGDGVNDILYVDGWGIKKLNFFRIFNRWGQLLFESTDVKVGWDGNYNGIPQNMETYVYQVSVETYLDKNGLQKTSSFRLIR